MSNALVSIIISSIAGFGTLIGSLILFIDFKDREGVSALFLSFSAFSISFLTLLELLPQVSYFFYIRYNLLISSVLIIISLIIGNIVIRLFEKISPLLSNDGLYRVGVISAICLTIHNFPEGIATFISSYNDLRSGLRLSLAILMHNIPEGIIISSSLGQAKSVRRSGVIYCLICSISEPLGAICAYTLFRGYLNELMLNIVLLIVSGLMIGLVINELIPQIIIYNNKKNSIIGAIVGSLTAILSLILL